MSNPIAEIKIPCALCKQETSWRGNPFRPFCSEVCRDKDLGNWATERYRVAADESPLESSDESQKGRRGGEE